MHSESQAKASSPLSMRAVVQDRYGSAEVLRVGRVPRPTLGNHDVLVEVRAAGVDRGTWHLMTGRPYLVRAVFGLRRPRHQVPGVDVAGTVVAVGSAVTRFSRGDEVFGFGRGSFAEYTAAREDKLARMPATLAPEQAAAVPVSAATALQALVDVGHVQPGHKVLVNGASGGVGTDAVQLAKHMGAEVTGVAGPAKLDLVRSLGADHVVDYTEADVAEAAAAYDLILDIGGNPTLSRLRRALTPTGTAVIVGGERGDALTGGLDRQLRATVVSMLGRQRFASFVARQRAVDLERLARLIEVGSVHPQVDSVYPLERAQDVMRKLEAGRARGKYVLTIA